jgi:hypothetical protein
MLKNRDEEAFIFVHLKINQRRFHFNQIVVMKLWCLGKLRRYED